MRKILTLACMFGSALLFGANAYTPDETQTGSTENYDWTYSAEYNELQNTYTPSITLTNIKPLSKAPTTFEATLMLTEDVDDAELFASSVVELPTADYAMTTSFTGKFDPQMFAPATTYRCYIMVTFSSATADWNTPISQAGYITFTTPAAPVEEKHLDATYNYSVNEQTGVYSPTLDFTILNAPLKCSTLDVEWEWRDAADESSVLAQGTQNVDVSSYSAMSQKTFHVVMPDVTPLAGHTYNAYARVHFTSVPLNIDWIEAINEDGFVTIEVPAAEPGDIGLQEPVEGNTQYFSWTYKNDIKENGETWPNVWITLGDYFNSKKAPETMNMTVTLQRVEGANEVLVKSETKAYNIGADWSTWRQQEQHQYFGPFDTDFGATYRAYVTVNMEGGTSQHDIHQALGSDDAPYFEFTIPAADPESIILKKVEVSDFTRTSMDSGTLNYVITAYNLDKAITYRLAAVTNGEKNVLDNGNQSYIFKPELTGTIKLKDLNESAETPVWVKVDYLLDGVWSPAVEANIVVSTKRDVNVNLTATIENGEENSVVTYTLEPVGFEPSEVEAWDVWADMVGKDKVATATTPSGTLTITEVGTIYVKATVMLGDGTLITSTPAEIMLEAKRLEADAFTVGAQWGVSSDETTLNETKVKAGYVFTTNEDKTISLKVTYQLDGPLPTGWIVPEIFDMAASPKAYTWAYGDPKEKNDIENFRTYNFILSSVEGEPEFKDGDVLTGRIRTAGTFGEYNLPISYTVGSDNEGQTGIENVMFNTFPEGAIFNLQGVRVNSNNLPAGIYIINGKKVLVK